MKRRQEALDYHSQGRKGKIEVVATKPCSTARDLSNAYSPGVAEPCLAIEKDPELAYEYTAKGNLVAVISNGTAVLGLGNIGALAGKPVMEGKGVLGVNLEDIKAPECFEIETRLKKEMNIPVFHDDQHGTAIISTAALMNASEIVGKKLGDMKVVFSGAGASAIACANMMIAAGVKLENLWLCDTKGLVYTGRTEGNNKYKDKFAKPSEWRTLADTIKDADVFVGCSSKGALSPEMLLSMAKDPIVFALANPDPEIDYPTAKATRDDIILATGRSDYPNQVNNVLGFPFIFRGALDVRASEINEPMKLAAAQALAALAKQEVPDSVVKAYQGQMFTFGREYIIPKPFDPRVLLWVAPAVAKAAMDSGVAKKPIADMQAYVERLEGLQGRSKDVIRTVVNRAKDNPKRVVFPEGDHPLILQAVSHMAEEGICVPILLGNAVDIAAVASDHGIDLTGIEILDPATVSWRKEAEDAFWKLRNRRGVTRFEASRKVQERIYFGALMCSMGKADGLIAGLTMYYPDTIRPCLEVIGTRKGVKRVCGVYTMVLKNRVLFFSDTTMNIEPNSEELAEIALLTADLVKNTFGMEPKVAMLSFSSFGSVEHPLVRKVQKATQLVKAARPELKCDGEMQADTALGEGILAENYPWVDLPGGPNVLIFPDLTSGNIGYKLVQRLANAEVIGPITCGMAAPVHVLQRHSDLNDIIHLTALTVVEAQQKK